MLYFKCKHEFLGSLLHGYFDTRQVCRSRVEFFLLRTIHKILGLLSVAGVEGFNSILTVQYFNYILNTSFTKKLISGDITT